MKKIVLCDHFAFHKKTSFLIDPLIEKHFNEISITFQQFFFDSLTSIFFRFPPKLLLTVLTTLDFLFFIVLMIVLTFARTRHEFWNLSSISFRRAEYRKKVNIMNKVRRKFIFISKTFVDSLNRWWAKKMESPANDVVSNLLLYLV